jgi:diguanylate cyclase (GGDEF)-like protein
VKLIACICQSNTRKIDVVCRYGGDEFVILLPENDLFAAAKVAERLRLTILNSPLRHNDQTIPISVSMGASKVSSEIRDLKSLLQTADEALYQAKTQGKDQIVIK